MLSPWEILAAMAGLPNGVRINILAELEACRVYEAERVAMTVMSADAAHELIASLVRGTVRS